MIKSSSSPQAKHAVMQSRRQATPVGQSAAELAGIAAEQVSQMSIAPPGQAGAVHAPLVGDTSHVRTCAGMPAKRTTLAKDDMLSRLIGAQGGAACEEFAWRWDWHEDISRWCAGMRSCSGEREHSSLVDEVKLTRMQTL